MKNIIQFLIEVRSELAKVEWPKWNEFIGSTVVVLLIVVAFSIYLVFVDFGFSRLARIVFKSYGLYY